MIYLELILLIIAAVISDVKTYKIKNMIIIISIMAGFITSLAIGGLPSLAGSIMAALLPILLLAILFALRMLGAGDIKLFCAIGAIAGVKFILYAMAYSFISGGIFAIIIMLLNKNFRKRWTHLLTYLKICLLTRSLHPYSDFTNKSDGSIFHFSYAIACGALITILTQ